MTRAVRKELGRQVSQVSGTYSKCVIPTAKTTRFAFEHFAVVNPNQETFGVRLDADDKLILKLRQDPFFEGKAILGECLEPNWNSGVAIRNPTFGAEFPKRELAVGSEMLEAKPSDLSSMPLGMCARQLSIGRPKMRNGTPL